MLGYLPPEVLSQICEHISTSHLYSLLQVSKACHKTATAVLYRQISLPLDELQLAITRWTNLLNRTNSWRAPRQITIADSTTIPSIETEDFIKSGNEALPTESKARPTQTDAEAVPLHIFLRKLPSLNTLTWYSDSAPAPSLTLLFQDELPHCKLHLKAFSVLYQPDLNNIRSLVTLPSLCSIWFSHTAENNLQHLIQQVVNRQGARLLDVRIFHTSTPASPYPNESPISWDIHPKQNGLARLQSLQLAGIRDDNCDDLRRWTRCADFSHLRHLSLEIEIPRHGLDFLLTLHLSSLNSLAITFDYSDTSDEYQTTVETFLCSVPPLSRLRLTGGCTASHLKSILEHHGKTLRTLYLRPASKTADRFVLQASTIALLVETCKHLLELGITIPRRWNSPGEDIAILSAIGRLSELSDLDLAFDASDHGSASPRELRSVPRDNPDNHIRDAFINSAIDADLAKAVFNTIVSSARRGASSPPLKTSRLHRLSLKATGGGDFGTGSFDYCLVGVVREVGRRWVVERPSCDGDLQVRRDKRTFWEPVEDLSWNIKPVFRRVWPNQGGEWFNEWQAFPLMK